MVGAAGIEPATPTMSTHESGAVTQHIVLWICYWRCILWVFSAFPCTKSFVQTLKMDWSGDFGCHGGDRRAWEEVTCLRLPDILKGEMTTRCDKYRIDHSDLMRRAISEFSQTHTDTPENNGKLMFV